MKHYHPKKNDAGKQVELKQPSQSSSMTTWNDVSKISTVVPSGCLPPAIAGIAVATWSDAPTCAANWEKLVESALFDEQPLKVSPGKKPASGVVVIEADGRVWVVSPSNRFGGYTHTFPKGTIYSGDNISLRANAMKEAHEESGLQVELIGFLVDSERSTTTTRYYLARRVGGSPADMGWESQAVNLVPLNHLAQFASHPNDAVIVQALHNRS